MKRSAVVILLAVVVGILLFAVAAFFVPRMSDTRLAFTVEDAVSKSWVWDATITLQNREIRSYYQSNRGPVQMTFTHLKAGRATLEVEAPNYVSVSMPVRIHLGNNVITKPIAMVGYRIPDLSSFAMFERQTKTGLSVQMRPVNSAGHVITELPCLDLWVGVLVSEEMKDGRPVLSATDSGAVRGSVLFRGKIDWSWDPSPSQSFRYNASIPYSRFAAQDVSYLVADYLVVVPDPRKISSSALDALMKSAPDFTSSADLRRYLDANRGADRYRYFFSTSWNVPGPGKASG